MDKNIFVFLLWMLTATYYVECGTRGKPKRVTATTEPHPYTISFFTFPPGAANELLEPKRESKRDNEDLSTHQKIKQAATGTDSKAKEDKKSSDVSKETKLSSKVSKITEIKKVKKQKDKKKHHQPKEKPKILDKGGKITEDDLDRGRHRVQPLEPWSLGPFHNKIQFNKHHTTNTEQAESYQEGSISHPSHTMYPKCHHCSSNSSYEDCSSKTTLKKCDSGLNNICYTKSFRSSSRGVIYEMGCSNHKTCRKAKAAPCKGAMKKCFVCCQFNGCNALEHHYFQSPESNDDDNLGYSAFNKATRSWQSTWSSLLSLSLSLVVWILT
ncbi:Hypothetical predicted protein [Paramuricea clavata]|uniref:Uncharacterized protein n=1 Tax=Paramuricea clavata TaxID=317549 RepID=A0A6S7FLY9_PARCT|nr:Hypothetical predicted protein [Paramuricea clavata]